MIATMFAVSAVAASLAVVDGEPAELVVEPSELTLQVDEPARLDAVVKDANGEVVDARVLFLPLYDQMWRLEERTWSFNLMDVQPDGTVTASRPGTFRIMVRVAGTSSSSGPGGEFLQRIIPVTVLAPPITRIELGAVPAALYAGTRVPLETTLVDRLGTVRTDVVPGFDSSAPEVARVDPTGTLHLLAPGSATVTARLDEAHATRSIDVAPNPTARLRLEASAHTARTGDVVQFTAMPEDAAGRPLDLPVLFSVNARTDPLAPGGPGSGLIADDGRFVADLPGEYTIVASAGAHVALRTLTVGPRDVRRPIELVGHGRVSDRGTSDLWVWEAPDGRDYAITGTRGADGRAYIWDVTDPANLRLIDLVQVDARSVNDVKVSEDGRLAVISREGASNRRNGVVVLDVSAPRVGVRVLSTYDDQLTGGVHNVSLHDGHLYALSAGRHYDVISLEDPTRPRRVGRFALDTPNRHIHDVVVRDGIAYSANWTDGVVVADVGGGGRGGSPAQPVKMGSFPFPTGWNHAVYPYRSASTGRFYIFAGDEAARTGSFSPTSERGVGTPGYDDEPNRWRGWIHVLAWDDGTTPEIVARYAVPEAGSHNMWIEDDIMYVAFYNGGLRVVDVSGALMGDLYRQGREIARFLPFDPDGFRANAPQVWGTQLHKGVIFFSDANSGLWAVRLRDTGDDDDVDDAGGAATGSPHGGQ